VHARRRMQGVSQQNYQEERIEEGWVHNKRRLATSFFSVLIVALLNLTQLLQQKTSSSNSIFFFVYLQPVHVTGTCARLTGTSSRIWFSGSR